jgi:uncharacterized membrane protein
MEAFSDGIFSIAATLLILDVTADASGGALSGTLQHSWPQYAAYAFGFVVIGIWWVNHHVFSDVLAKTDRIHLFFNTLFLACIAFLPFPIRLVAKHVWDEGARAAVVTYGLTTTLAAIFALISWLYASTNRRLISEKVDQETIDHITRSIIPGTPINAGATLVALWNPHFAIVLLLALTVFYVIGTSLSKHD